MTTTSIINVPHLGGIEAAYQMPEAYDSNKPTLVLVNAFTTSSELYRAQFSDSRLTDQMNLVAIELLGHGQTRTAREQWTYWDTAEMNLQVLDALKVDRAFVLGTSQGGWVTVQMALLRPEKVLPQCCWLFSSLRMIRSWGLFLWGPRWIANRIEVVNWNVGMARQLFPALWHSGHLAKVIPTSNRTTAIVTR